MSEYLAATILGIVQGFTEFLPISSSGHLIITSTLMGMSGARIKTFEVVIQLGSILAVVALYWPRFQGLLIPPRTARGRYKTRFAGLRGLFLLFLTSFPASLVGLVAHKYITRYLFNPVSVAAALAVGALFILLAEWYTRNARVVRTPDIDALTPKMALGIGCFQCLSLWPGFSRSTSTIMGAMLLGSNRSVAAEYSFLAAVPIMVAATGFSLISAAGDLTRADIPFFLVGSLVSFLAALVAIKILVSLISRISFIPFALYRLALAPLVFWFFY